MDAAAIQEIRETVNRIESVMVRSSDLESIIEKAVAAALKTASENFKKTQDEPEQNLEEDDSKAPSRLPRFHSDGDALLSTREKNVSIDTSKSSPPRSGSAASVDDLFCLPPTSTRASRKGLVRDLRRSFSAPAELIEHSLKELEGDLAAIFRFFADTEDADGLTLDNIITMQKVQGDCTLLTDLNIGELDSNDDGSVSLMEFYRFVVAEYDQDDYSVVNWLEAMWEHMIQNPKQSPEPAPKEGPGDAAELAEATKPGEPAETAEATKPVGIVEPPESTEAAKAAGPISCARSADPERPMPVYATATDALNCFVKEHYNHNIPRILQDWSELLRLTGLSSGCTYQELRDTLQPQLNYNLKRIFKALDDRICEAGTKDANKRHGLYKTKPLSGVKAVVVGAGPAGLRCSIELRMMGAEVIVMEKRGFERNNILHLWDWVQEDLMSLGAKIMYPKFGSAAEFLHIGTKQLQSLLFKASLLLGVDYHFHTEFEDLVEPTSDADPWKVRARRDSKDIFLPCDLAIGATGVRGLVCQAAEFSFKEIRMSDALGLVVNFSNNNTNEEKNLKEFSWARHFNEKLFNALAENGFDLENAVYYKGETHYFVMTPKKRSLLDFGAFVRTEDADGNEFLETHKPDPVKLMEYARGVVNYFKLPKTCEVVGRPQVFDFSKRRYAEEPMRVLTHGDRELVVGAVGDALLEPFWPEGLGITRGFLGVLDTCWVLRHMRTAHDSEQMCHERKELYDILKSLNDKSRNNYLIDKAGTPLMKEFGLNPASRYKGHYLTFKPQKRPASVRASWPAV